MMNEEVRKEFIEDLRVATIAVNNLMVERYGARPTEITRLQAENLVRTALEAVDYGDTLQQLWGYREAQ